MILGNVMNLVGKRERLPVGKRARLPVGKRARLPVGKRARLPVGKLVLKYGVMGISLKVPRIVQI